MHRKRSFKRSWSVERLLENMFSYLFVLIFAIFIFDLLTKLPKSNVVVTKNLKSSSQKAITSNHNANPKSTTSKEVVADTLKTISSSQDTKPKSTITKKVGTDNQKVKLPNQNTIPNSKKTKNISSNNQSSISNIRKVQANPVISKNTNSGKSVVIKKIRRSEAFNRGMNIINYVWEYDANKNGISLKEDVALPNYLKGVKKIKISGLPYCWGGYTSLDMSFDTDVKNFQEALNKGYIAGNVNCIGNYKYHTAGLDCSGFVCSVFKIPEKCNTDNIRRYFNVINMSKLRPMDILDCVNKHVIIYLCESNNKKGILTMEASYNNYSKNSEKTKINYRSWDSIKKGLEGKSFIAMRYKGIIEDTAKLFKDNTEYNFDEQNATLVKLDNKIKGYIDYADDKDYFDINVNKDTKYILQILKMPKFCNLVIFNSKGKIIKNIQNQGSYNFNLSKDLYYIRVESNDFKYSENEFYSFKLQLQINPQKAKPKYMLLQATKTQKNIISPTGKTNKSKKILKTDNKKLMTKKGRYY